MKCSSSEGEDGGVHGEGGDEVPGEHEDVRGAEFRDGEKDLPRIQPDLWALSPPRLEL